MEVVHSEWEVHWAWVPLAACLLDEGVHLSGSGSLVAVGCDSEPVLAAVHSAAAVVGATINNSKICAGEVECSRTHLDI